MGYLLLIRAKEVGKILLLKVLQLLPVNKVSPTLRRSIVLPKCVGGKEHFVSGAVAHHLLGPMEHRCRDEAKGSLADTELGTGVNNKEVRMNQAGMQPL